MRFQSGSATAAAATVLGLALTVAVAAEGGSAQQQQVLGAQTEAMSDYLWETFDRHLSRMRFIDLTHTIRPDMPIWRGFGNSTFSAAVNRLSGEPFTYATDGFVATAYGLTTDQMGTQLDAPAHFNPLGAASDEIPATYALSKLVVIDVSPKVRANATYAVDVDDILEWERQYGRVPARAVVFVRSDWSRAWPRVNTDEFPQVSLEAVQFLHRQRNILFHGHEPLDADMTPNFDAESWILRNGYAQAEGVANLHLVPPTGCLLSTGLPKFAGGVGHYARFVALCPAEWPYGAVPAATSEAPMPLFAAPLEWSSAKGYRVR
ncbi:hypothetical protein IWW48_005721 [Coemansia sp. RSA 1200]|nr:hypothetical protein IWW48_005721 [Coemansia sp. RSA 1200]